MHLNPICHWSGGNLPLFNWAPGSDDAADPQMPVAMPFYDTVAALAAVGVPAPVILHPCQEAAGTGTIADVTGGGAGLTCVGNYIQGQRVPPLWDPVNKNFHGYYRRGFEVEDYVWTAGAYCADLAKGNAGGGSFANFIVYRRNGVEHNGALVGKKKGPGWAYTGPVDYPSIYLDDGAGHSAYVNSANSYSPPGSVVCVFGFFNVTTGFCRVWSSGGGWGVAANIAAFGSLDNAFPLCLYAGRSSADTYLRSFNGHILYHAMWMGANAEDMANNFDATYVPILCPQYISGDSPNTATYDGEAAAYGPTYSICGEDPVTGICIAEFNRTKPAGGKGQFPWAYDPLVSGTTKLVAAMGGSQGDASTFVPDSEIFQYAGWSFSAITNTYAFADLANGPNGFHEAQKLAATASPGYAYFQVNLVIANVYAFSFFHKRTAAMGANVSGRLVAWNVTGSAEIASVAFSSTDKWQETHLEFVAPVVATQMRIEITTSGESIHAMRMGALRGGLVNNPVWRRQYVNPYWGTPTTYYKEFATCAEAMDPTKGEIEVVCRRHTTGLPTSDNLQYLCALNTGIDSINTFNKRELFIDATGQLIGTIRNSAGVVVATANAGVVDFTTERTVQFRWDIAGLPSGNTAEIIVDGGAPVSGAVAGWATSDTVLFHIYGAARADTGSSHRFIGSVKHIKIWGAPQ